MTHFQDAMKAAMIRSGLPHKEINVYGSQIVVTVCSLRTANEWKAFIAGFARVRAVIESLDYAAVNKGTKSNPTMVPVWRIFAMIP